MYKLRIQSGFWYVGTPYSKYAAGIEQAWTDACLACARLIEAGVPVYSPIAHTHPIAVLGEIDPYAHDIWLPADRPLMEAAHGMILLMMPGWRESRGIWHEVEHFWRAGKPVVPLAWPVRETRQ